MVSNSSVFRAFSGRFLGVFRAFSGRFPGVSGRFPGALASFVDHSA